MDAIRVSGFCCDELFARAVRVILNAGNKVHVGRIWSDNQIVLAECHLFNRAEHANKHLVRSGRFKVIRVLRHNLISIIGGISKLRQNHVIFFGVHGA